MLIVSSSSIAAKNSMASHMVAARLTVIIFFLILLFSGSASLADPPPTTVDGPAARDANTASGADTTSPATLEEEFVVGKVEAVSKPEVNKDLLEKTGMVSNRQLVQVRVLEGKLKGARATIANEITDNPAYNVGVKTGDEVILSIVSQKRGGAEINIADYHRAPALIWLAVAFLSAFLVFGGRHGVKSLLGLIVSVCLVGFVLLPLSLNGYNPLLVSAVICLLAAGANMLFVAGWSRKALASVVGTVGGVAVAAVAAQLVILAAPLTGLSSEEAQILRGSVLHQKPEFYSGLLAAGMLIGALGVIMDVGISIASAVHEVSLTGSELTARRLYQSGMNVGRDIMGTMTNTLILAYTGGALPLLLLASQMPSVKLINLDLVATEVASALSGSLGLVITIPLTALAASILMSRPEDNKAEKDFLMGDGVKRVPEAVEGD